MLDNVKNFVIVTVSMGYNNTDTSIVLASSEGAKLPDPAVANYNLVWYNFTDYSSPLLDPNVEIIRVTAKSTDTLTVTRGQESISATTKNTADKTYKMILSITAKTITDIDTILKQNNPSNTWIAQSASAAKQWHDVCYGNGLFVAAAFDSGTASIMTSPDGVNWTTRTSIAGYFNKIDFLNGLFLVSGAGTISTSLNGITWTAVTTVDASTTWQGFAYGNGVFVNVGLNGTSTYFIQSSPDAITWTARTVTSGDLWYDVTFGNGVFVIVGTSYIATSTDGITWTNRTPAATTTLYSVTYGNGLFVAVGTSNVMTSPDGTTWTSRTIDESNNWCSVVYGNGYFVAVAGNGTHRVIISRDGITWTLITSTEQNSWVGITYSNGLFVAVSSDGTNRVMVSGYLLTSPYNTVSTIVRGALTLAENASIALDPAGSADGKYSGITVTGIGGATIAFGDLVTLDKDDSRWELVDISVAAAATGDARGQLGMAVTSSTDGTAITVLLSGIIRADANFPALTIGAAVYASTTGDVVVAQPSTTDYVIRIIGSALTADELFFNPSADWITPI